jgi:formamidopyrimidine-DNA glycosylase
VFRLSDDWLLVHLKMSGRLQLADEEADPNPYAHVVLPMDDKTELRFHCPRKFGRMYLVSDPGGILGSLGPEPLSSEFGPDVFSELMAQRRGMLKPLLLNQQFIAGLGNIYADESLWASELHPQRRADTLRSGDISRLYWSIRATLVAAIEARGTSLTEGGYRDLTGNMGEMQGSLNVFDRTGEPCPRCGEAITKIRVGGRGTHLCPRCQRAP